MYSNFLQQFKRIHFVGIGGISMSGLAEYLNFRGFFVSGSDANNGEIISRMSRKGIKIYIGHKAENVLKADLVVYNSAIKEDNPEIVSAKKNNIFLTSRIELLAEIMKDFKYTVAIGGSHGKTTATAMCMHAVYNATENATAHIGGEDAKFMNFYNGGNKFFITEACEFKRNFLQLKPTTSVLLNCDKDHLDCYKNERDLYETFIEFAENSPIRIVNKDDAIAKKVTNAVTFSLDDITADYFAYDIKSNRGKYSFCISERGETACKIHLDVYGKHNIYNALAAFAAGRYYRLNSHLLARGIENFTGVLRRFELLGKANGAEFIADYAHHPNEITAVISAAKEVCEGRLFVVFQPHTYSRTKLLFNDFIAVLKDVENLVVYKTYAAREYFDNEGSALTLSQSLPNSLYAETVKELRFYLKPVLEPCDMVLFLGAGDIYYAAKLLLKQFD